MKTPTDNIAGGSGYCEICKQTVPNLSLHISVEHPTPTARRITPDDPPQFPCWLWIDGEAFRNGGFWLRYEHTRPVAVNYTYWHPDQPTAPAPVSEAQAVLLKPFVDTRSEGSHARLRTLWAALAESESRTSAIREAINRELANTK